MPSKSKAQQRYMQIAEHNPSALRGPKPAMTQQQLHDFASGSMKGKPEHVGMKAAQSSHPNASRLGHFLHPKKAR